MKWLLLLAVMLLPGLVDAQTSLTDWKLNSNSNTSRSISCGTEYTLKVTTSGTSTRDQYCTITSSNSTCPITVTLTANSLKPTGVTATNYAYVYNGSGTGGTQLAEWTSSTSTGTSVTSTAGTVTIRFDRNSTIASGVTFTVKIYQPCNCGTVPTSYSCVGDIHQIGTGTSSATTYGPVNDFYKYSYRQILYHPSEFDYRPGEIRAIAFQYAYATTMQKKVDCKIYMANTNVSAFASSTSWITTGLQQVYSGVLNFQQGWGWVVLDTPFNYTGGELVVVIDDNSGEYDGSSYAFYYSGTSADGNVQIYKASDSEHFSNTNLPESDDYPSYSYYRPNTKFCIVHNCDLRPDNFAFANENVTVTAGQSYTQDVTGGQNVTYTMTCNPTGIATFNATTHTVTTVAGSEGTVTVTAKWPASNGYCDKYATYTINVGDGCTQVGSGTSTTSYLPIYTSSTAYYSYTQQVYTAAEILAAGGCQGTINDIKFQYSTSATANYTQSIKVYMGTTSQSSLASAWIGDAGLQQVYNGSVTFAPGWNTIHLNTPFEWNGVDNIVVAVMSNGTTGTTSRYFHYNSTTGGARYYYSTSSFTLNGSNIPTSAGYSSSSRPNIRFCIDCCEDNLTGTFAFQYESINYVIGSGTPMANALTNQTGQTTGLTYSSSNTSVTVTNAGVVTIPNNIGECDVTITAKLNNANGCNRYAHYVIHIIDGCATAGDGTSTTYTAPVYNSGTSGYYSYSQMIYGAEEILNDGGCQGEIRTIKFKSSTTENFSQSVQIYMGTTLTNDLSSGWLTGNEGLQLVYSGSVTFLASAWTSITLQNSFYWNGLDNIVVAVKSTSASGSTSRYFYYTSFTTSTMRYAYSSSAQIAL